MKRTCARMAAALLAAILFLPCNAKAISAKSAVVMDGVTGRLLYEKNCNSKSLIASTTKIMTALVICEQCNVLDRVRIPKEAVGIEGSSMYLQAGEILTVQELLYGMMLHSGNDAATALAIYCGGTLEGFVQLMNDKARVLSMVNTHFGNPHGLDHPDNYSTAEDLAILAAYAMDNPIFAKTVSTRQIQIGNRYLRNHNKLLWRVDGADGVKTGYTRAAGRILVSSANRQGRRLIAVTISAPDDWNDHSVMLEKGFTEFSVKTLINNGDCIGYLPVAGSKEQQVSLLSAVSFSYAVAENEKIEICRQNTPFVYAPVALGQDAGYGNILVAGPVVGKIPVVYGETLEQIPVEKKSFWKRMFGD